MGIVRGETEFREGVGMEFRIENANMINTIPKRNNKPNSFRIGQWKRIQIRDERRNSGGGVFESDGN